MICSWNQTACCMSTRLISNNQWHAKNLCSGAHLNVYKLNGNPCSYIMNVDFTACSYGYCILQTQKRIRSEVYCKQLFDLDERLRSIVSSMCLIRDTDCIEYYPNPGYLTPSQIMDSIRLWHESVVSPSQSQSIYIHFFPHLYRSAPIGSVVSHRTQSLLEGYLPEILLISMATGWTSQLEICGPRVF